MYSSAFFFWNAFDGIKDKDRRGKQQQQQTKKTRQTWNVTSRLASPFFIRAV